MDLTQYIKSDLLILIPVLWLIHALFKRTPKFPEWLIPYVLGVIGIIGSAILECDSSGMTMKSFFNAFIQGVLVTGVSVGGNHLANQMMQKYKAIDPANHVK